MKHPLGATVKKLLERRLREVFPGLQRVRKAAIPGGSDLYEWKHTDMFRCYLHCQLHRYEDSFTMRIGWTLSGTFPGLGPPPTSPYDEPANGGLVFPLGMLWTGSDYWWKLQPTVDTRGSESTEQPRLDSVVQDVVDKLNEYAVPYFRNIAARYGVSFASTK